MATWADPRVKLKAEVSIKKCLLENGDPKLEVTGKSQVRWESGQGNLGEGPEQKLNSQTFR